MTQNNLYMEDDNLRLYVDVQPLFLDELEKSKNAAQESAIKAKQYEETAKNLSENISDYKARIELFYAQASDNLNTLLNDLQLSLNNAANSALDDIQTAKTTILNNMSVLAQQSISSVYNTGNNILNQVKDYTQEAKSAVDNRVSLDYLDASRGHKTGKISYNPENLKWIKEIAHSTYCGNQSNNASPLDPKKFTVTGSPVITNETSFTPGIASGFSANDYLKIPLDNDVYRFNFEFKTKDTVMENYLFGGNSTYMRRILMWVGSYGVSTSIFKSDGTRAQISNNLHGRLLPNTEYFGFVEYDGAKYTVGIKTADEENYVTTTTVSDFVSDLQDIYIMPFGSDNKDFSVDLKQYSITEYGVPVFSGNKTGIDTIKADDYTVVGNPTITADGVVSGFSGTVGAKAGIKILPDLSSANNKVFVFEGYFNYTNAGATQALFWFYPTSESSNRSMYLSINADKGINTAIYDLGYTQTSNIFTNDGIYHIKYETDLTSYYKVYVNDILCNSATFTTTGTKTVGKITLGYTEDAASYWANSIDLNAFKIYVDWDLVYQPCLKIPYTESKTGSKIVDSVYRNRVKDVYDQFGCAMYYTLQEEIKENYTVIGNPTINNGVVSNLSASNYIEVGARNFSDADNWKINLKSKTPSAFIASANILHLAASNNLSIVLQTFSNGALILYLSSTGTTWDIASNIASGTKYLQPNTEYEISVEFTGTQYIIKANGQTFITVDSSEKVHRGPSKISVCNSSGMDKFYLNEFEIYKNGNLVYETTIKPNFTPPMGEVYGMIGKVIQMID